MRMEEEVFEDGQTFKSYSLSDFAPHKMELFWISYLPFVKTSTVRDFRRQFEVLASPLREVAEAVLESAFINGLERILRLR